MGWFLIYHVLVLDLRLCSILQFRVVFVIWWFLICHAMVLDLACGGS